MSLVALTTNCEGALAGELRSRCICLFAMFDSVQKMDKRLWLHSQCHRDGLTVCSGTVCLNG